MTVADLLRSCRPAPAAALGLALVLSACAGLGAQKGAGDPKTDLAIDDATRNAAAAADAASDYRTAAGNWALLYQRHPDDAVLALHLARSLRYSRQFGPAIDTASNFVERHGPSAPLLTELGKDYLAADRLPLAVRTLRQAADLAPKDWDALSTLGVALDYQGKYAEAQAAYAKALAQSPDNPVVLNNLGLSQAEAGQLQQAEATLQQAADQPRATAQVRQNLALIKALAGDVTAAERLSRQDLPPEAVRANTNYYRLLAGAARVQ